jgi:hypothetical protein
LVTVAKDADTKEIKPLSLVFKITDIEGQVKLKHADHPQNFFYVIVDP